MLESVKRAYDKGCFDQNDPEKICPVELETIELYLQLLRPAYVLSICLQSSKSTIANVIPGLAALCHYWQTVDTNQEAKDLCEKLIYFTKEKFDFELNSNLYKVNIYFKK